MLQLKIHFNYHTYAMYMYLRDVHVHTVLFSTYDVLKQKPDQIRMYLN